MRKKEEKAKSEDRSIKEEKKRGRKLLPHGVVRVLT